MTGPKGAAADSFGVFGKPVVRWLMWGAAVALLAGWDAGGETARQALSTSSLVFAGILVLDVVATAVVKAGSRAAKVARRRSADESGAGGRRSAGVRR